MGASLEYMRDFVAGAYPSDNWRIKVMNMPPNQVKAIFINLKKKKKLTLKPKKNKEYEQLTLWDIDIFKKENNYE